MGSLVTVMAVAAGGAATVILLTPLLARLATRYGLVSKARPDRWSGRPTPLLGGVAIVAGALGPAAVVSGASATFWTVAVCTVAAMVLGLIDDTRGLRPTSKVVGQFAIASGLAIGGVRSDLFQDIPVVAIVVTVLWVVMLMNALNLTDNMDGLAAGLSAIAAGVLVVMAPRDAAWVAPLAAASAAACAGFLVHNFPPARVFMGDAGSMALGCLLAALSLVATNEAASGVGLAILAPLLALGLPIFDTALVTLVRGLEGRPVSQGGRDHTSHRLAALGLSERETVLVMYGIAVGMAILGLLAGQFGLGVIPLVALVVIALALFGAFLVERPSDVAMEIAGGSRRRVVGSGNRLVRYGSEILLDVALVTLALFSSYLLRFESVGAETWAPLFVAALPIVLPIQLAAFVTLGMYRVLWRFLSVIDLAVIARACVTGTAAAGVAVLLLQQGFGQSRGVFLIDGILLTVMVAASRVFLVSLRDQFGRRRRGVRRRVLIVGATETGEIALRLLLHSVEPLYQPAGFIDDDPGKHRRSIAGVPVLGTVDEMTDIARREQADLIVAVIDDAGDRLDRVREQCAAAGLELREFTSI